MKLPWYIDGIKFQCQGSGNCCISRGEYGFVYLTLEDRKRLAKELKVPTAQFTKKYCQKSEGFYHLIQSNNQTECLFLKSNKCSVYKSRPTQCKTWPFWPEVMSPKAWKKDVAGFCPGVGKGRVWSIEEIQTNLNEQIDVENQLQKENKL